MGSPSHTNNWCSFISCFSLDSELKKKGGGRTVLKFSEVKNRIYIRKFSP